MAPAHCQRPSTLIISYIRSPAWTGNNHSERDCHPAVDLLLFPPDYDSYQQARKRSGSTFYWADSRDLGRGKGGSMWNEGVLYSYFGRSAPGYDFELDRSDIYQLTMKS